MNRTVRRISALVVVLFLSLMASTTALQFFQRDELNTHPRNIRAVFAEYNNARGPIVVDGVPVAESIPVDSPFGFQRVFGGGDPTRAAMYAPITGFFSISVGSSGIERGFNQYLNGRAPSLWVDRVHNMLTGQPDQGSSVELTVNDALQRRAWELLDGQRGAIFAIDPRTGAILAMVTYPSYDPNLLAVLSTSQANTAYQEALAAPHRPMYNRVLQSVFPPGSTYKMIVAAAALEAGIGAHQQVPAPHRMTLPGTAQVVRNFRDEACSATGYMSIHDAMVISCNTAFMMLAGEVGVDALRDMSERFGFNESLRIPMIAAPSFFPGPGFENFGPDRLALAGMGQGDLNSTPLTMAMMAQVIANDGVMMQPYLVQTIRDPQLEVVWEATPEELRRVVSPAVAADLQEMMTASVMQVAGGRTTGWRARVPGVEVAGKTGTAQTSPGEAPHVWFSGFAPAEDPTIAFVVMIENGGHLGMEATGGNLAAPIAAQLVRTHLGITE